MPPPGKSRGSRREKPLSTFSKYLKKYATFDFAKSLVFDPTRLPIVTVAILLGELLINIFVVQRVNYTEIDWVAYMQECEGFINGTTNYSLLKGDTGPLVYPAGFVYIYSALYFLTSAGSNIRLAQYFFICIYLLQLFLVLRLYGKTQKIPPYVLVLTTFTSYRIHSIYVLRLFNDPVAIVLLYVAINLFIDGRWSLGSVFFSLAVSVKMNILLFAPAVGLMYIACLGIWKTVQQLSICAAVQLLLGAPFLLTHPVEYLKGSFDLGRVFEHKWTVNFRFLDKSIFEDRYFHLGLLGLHMLLLIVFLPTCFTYFKNYARLRTLQKQMQPQIDAQNAAVKARKTATKKTSKNVKIVEEKKEEEEEEALTQDQQKFLDAFEQTLKKNAGISGNSPPPPVEKAEPESDHCSIDFDRCTQLVLLPLFLVNFIGVLCARSLHYQFYVWYFHTLPYLAWFTNYSTSGKFLILAVIEYCWNTYPSTDLSSFLLHAAHFLLLLGIGRKLLGQKRTLQKLREKEN